MTISTPDNDTLRPGESATAQKGMQWGREESDGAVGNASGQRDMRRRRVVSDSGVVFEPGVASDPAAIFRSVGLKVGEWSG